MIIIIKVICSFFLSQVCLSSLSALLIPYFVKQTGQKYFILLNARLRSSLISLQQAGSWCCIELWLWQRFVHLASSLLSPDWVPVLNRFVWNWKYISLTAYFKLALTPPANERADPRALDQSEASNQPALAPHPGSILLVEINYPCSNLVKWSLLLKSDRPLCNTTNNSIFSDTKNELSALRR